MQSECFVYEKYQILVISVNALVMRNTKAYTTRMVYGIGKANCAIFARYVRYKFTEFDT